MDLNFYIIDWDKVVREYAAVKLRLAKRLAWLRVFVWFVRVVYNDFMAYRADTVYRLTHNSQVCFMEGMLNDTFDPEDRTIYISDGPYASPLYIYLDIEEKPVYLAKDSELPVSEYEAPVYLPTDLETGELGCQFIVYYPEGLVFDIIRMRALVNRDRLPSKSFNIQSY